jgi:predicted metal-binding protein
MNKHEIEEVLRGRAWEYSDISTAALDFSPELLKACETNVCGNYNKNWTCPPAVGTLEEQREKIVSFKRAFVFTTKYDLEDSFDIDGMRDAKEIHNQLTVKMRERCGGANPVYGAGGCTICKKCAYPETCRCPEQAISSVEAAGINVTELSRAAGVKYNNGPNTVTYFSMVLFDS